MSSVPHVRPAALSCIVLKRKVVSGFQPEPDRPETVGLESLYDRLEPEEVIRLFSEYSLEPSDIDELERKTQPTISWRRN